MVILTLRERLEDNPADTDFMGIKLPVSQAMTRADTTMTKTYEDETTFLKAIAEHPKIAELHQTVRESLLDGIKQATLKDAELQTHAGQAFRLGRWFIRNDDLPFLELIATAVGIIVVISASGGVVAAALTAKIAGFVSSTWKIWRKGAVLNKDQLLVLSVLDSRESQQIDRIADALNLAQVSFNLGQLTAILNSLTMIELYDGTEVELVRLDEKGWRCLRV